MILPSVFVQIPSQSASLTSSKTNASQTVTRHDEIKAEPPIKSEIDNANQSQAIIPSKHNKDGSQTNPSKSNKSFSSTCDQSKLTANLVTARPKVKCLKCEKCPFISISQQGYDDHIKTVHSNDTNGEHSTNRAFRNKILCPGCENVFYSKMSLKIHLVNDHQMNRSDISQLLDSLFAKKSSTASSISSHQSDQITNENATTAENSAEKTVAKRSEKQKIYLKNVEVLQNPKFTARQFGIVQDTLNPRNLSSIENRSSTNLANDILNSDNTNISELNFSRISVHNNSFNQLTNECLFQEANIESTPTFSFISPSLSPQTTCNLSLNDGRDHIILDAISPAISTTPVDDSNVYRPDSSNSIKFSENLLNTETTWTPITSSSSNDGNSNFITYQSQVNLNLLSNDNTSTNINPTPTVSPLSTVSSSYQNEKKKIFIKNIDILKEPLIKPVQTVTLTDSNCRKNTLHLRTVDEVNLLINKVSVLFLFSFCSLEYFGLSLSKFT